jgi:uncharacterized membrane protein YbhN (UPF0104 family)
LYHRWIVEFLRGVAGALAHADLRYVLAAVALHLAGLIVTGQRWRGVIAALGLPITLFRAVLVNLAGIFVRNATPTTGLGGDASRVALLRLEGLSLAQGTATVLYVRAAELPAMAALVALAVPIVGSAIRRSAGRYAAVAAVAALLAGLAWLARRRLQPQLAAIRVRARQVRISWSALAVAILLATVAQAETVARQIVVAAALGVPLTVSQSATVTAFSIAGGLVPTVGSVGPVEGSLVAGLIMCGVPADAALAVTLVERVISYGLSTLLGAGALGPRRTRRPAVRGRADSRCDRRRLRNRATPSIPGWTTRGPGTWTRCGSTHPRATI